MLTLQHQFYKCPWLQSNDLLIRLLVLSDNLGYGYDPLDSDHLADLASSASIRKIFPIVSRNLSPRRARLLTPTSKSQTLTQGEVTILRQSAVLFTAKATIVLTAAITWCTGGSCQK